MSNEQCSIEYGKITGVWIVKDVKPIKQNHLKVFTTFSKDKSSTIPIF